MADFLFQGKNGIARQFDQASNSTVSLVGGSGEVMMNRSYNDITIMRLA
jgi:hypothetical protein